MLKQQCFLLFIFRFFLRQLASREFCRQDRLSSDGGGPLAAAQTEKLWGSLSSAPHSPIPPRSAKNLWLCLGGDSRSPGMAPRVLCETQTQSTTPAAPRMNRRKLLLARTARRRWNSVKRSSVVLRSEDLSTQNTIKHVCTY